MEPLLLAAANALNAAGLGAWASGSALAYPIANVAHVLGVIALVGAIGILDLRLAGVWRDLPLAPLARALTPLAIAGLVAIIASGIILFAADGTALARSSTFHWKLGLILFAIANAALFRHRWQGTDPGPAGRAMAIASLALWVAIVITGRMIAYS